MLCAGKCVVYCSCRENSAAAAAATAEAVIELRYAR